MKDFIGLALLGGIAVFLVYLVRGWINDYRKDSLKFMTNFWGIILIIQALFILYSLTNTFQYAIFHDFTKYGEDDENPYIIYTLAFAGLMWFAGFGYKRNQDALTARTKYRASQKEYDE